MNRDITFIKARQTMSEYKDVISALDAVTWYNGLAETVYGWSKLPVNEYSNNYKQIMCPLNPPKDWWEHQLEVLWMIAVEMFGDYGTSPRFGWIENVDEFKQWVLDITETWRESDEFAKEVEDDGNT